MHIYIDADACPVKTEAIRVATRYKLTITLVSNQGMRPIPQTNVQQIVVSAAFDAADDWIIEQITTGDIVITADIPLAARALEKHAKALNPNGKIFTQQNIGSVLAMRNLNAHLRETGEIAGYNPPFSSKQRSDFLQNLDRLIQLNK